MNAKTNPDINSPPISINELLSNIYVNQQKKYDISHYVSSITSELENFCLPCNPNVDNMIHHMLIIPSQNKNRLSHVYRLARGSDELVAPIYTAIKKQILSVFENDLHTTLTNKYADEIYKNVYLKWQQLSTSAQKFYSTLLSPMKKTNNINEWEPMSESDFNNVYDPTTIRLNMNKIGNTHNTIFESSLPLLPPNIFENFWYTDFNNKKVRVSLEHTDESSRRYILRNIYDVVYRFSNDKKESTYMNVQIALNSTRSITLYLPSIYENGYKILSKDFFSLNFDKIKMARLDKKLHTSDKFSYANLPYDMIRMSSYYRDENGELYGKLPDESVVKINDVNSVADALLKANYKCYTTMVEFKTKMQCDVFLNECVLSDDDTFAKCLDFVNMTSEFEEVTREQIWQMHPKIALKILDRFGFSKHNDYNSEYKCNLERYQTIKEWRETSVKEFFKNSPKMIEKLNTDCPFVKYLQNVNDFVTANPAFLNNNIRPNKKVACQKPVEWLEAIGIKRRRETHAPYNGTFPIAEKIYLRNLRLQPNLSKDLLNLPSPQLWAPSHLDQYLPRERIILPSRSLSPSPSSPLSQLSSMQFGGGHVNFPISGNAFIRQLFADAKKRLATVGVKLDPKDDINIGGALDQHQMFENMLQDNIKHFDAYYDIVKKYRITNDTRLKDVPIGKISFEQLKKTSDELSETMKGYQNYEQVLAGLLGGIGRILIRKDYTA